MVGHSLEEVGHILSGVHSRRSSNSSRQVAVADADSVPPAHFSCIAGPSTAAVGLVEDRLSSPAGFEEEEEEQTLQEEHGKA